MTNENMQNKKTEWKIFAKGIARMVAGAAGLTVVAQTVNYFTYQRNAKDTDEGRVYTVWGVIFRKQFVDENKDGFLDYSVGSKGKEVSQERQSEYELTLGGKN